MGMKVVLGEAIKYLIFKILQFLMPSLNFMVHVFPSLLFYLKEILCSNFIIALKTASGFYGATGWKPCGPGLQKKRMSSTNLSGLINF